MEKEYAITKSNLRMLQKTYGCNTRSELVRCFTQTPAVINIEMEVISRFIRTRLAAGSALDCTNTLYHYYNDDIKFGELINNVLSGEMPGKGR